MARSSRSAPSRPAARPAPARAPAAAAPAAPHHPPAPVHSQPPMTMQAPPQQPSMLAGIGSTIAQGMAFGTGSAIAHRAVGAASDALFGGGEKQAPVAPAPTPDQIPRMQMVNNDQFAAPGPCDADKQMFFECLKTNKGDQQSCSFLYDTLQACQRSSSEMRF